MTPHRLDPVLRHLRNLGGNPAADLPDAALLVRFVANGDEAAFAVLVRRHGPMVLGVCGRLLEDVHATEDAFQATFLLLVKKARWLRQPDRLGPWLYGVARRVALKARSVTNRRREVAPVDVPAPTPSESLDLRPLLDAAIARLPDRYRVPVVLCYLQGLTYAEAATRLHCPAGTVATRLSRAKDRLRVLLIRQGMAPAAGAIAAALAPDSIAATVPLALRNAAVQYAVGASIIPAGVLTLTKGVGHAMILNKVKMTAVVALFGMAGTGAWVYGPAAAAPPINTPTQPPGQPVVREDPKPAAEATRFETANFVVTAPTAEIAREFGEAAERERKSQAVLWLGAEMPAWSKRCPLTVKPTTGGSGGATKFNFDLKGNYEVLSMALEGEVQKTLTSVLPHEITHTVLAHYFRCQVPRWADEGAAVLAESEDERRHHDLVTHNMLNTRKAMPVRQLLVLKDYAEFSDVVIVYAQGYSLTQFLVSLKDRPTFLRFVERGTAGNWDIAAKVCYDFGSVEMLEAAWLAEVKAKRNEAGETPAAVTADTLDSRANEAYRAKEYEKAVSLWCELQQRFPDDPRAFYANLRLGCAYWSIARQADQQLRADGRHDDNELSASRRNALMRARDSYQIIEQTMIAGQLTGSPTIAGDDEKLKEASFWGADCDFWLARFEMAQSRYSALAIRYKGKPEEMIALAQMRICWDSLRRPDRANATTARMRERLGAIKFDPADGVRATNKREYWEKFLAEIAKPVRPEVGPPPGE